MHLKLKTRIKYYFYKLKVINREPINRKFKIIEAKIIKIIFKIFKGHLKYIVFNIAPIKQYKIILKIP
jgi:hypothetical protein